VNPPDRQSLDYPPAVLYRIVGQSGRRGPIWSIAADARAHRLLYVVRQVAVDLIVISPVLFLAIRKTRARRFRHTESVPLFLARADRWIVRNVPPHAVVLVAATLLFLFLTRVDLDPPDGGWTAVFPVIGSAIATVGAVVIASRVGPTSAAVRFGWPFASVVLAVFLKKGRRRRREHVLDRRGFRPPLRMYLSLRSLMAIKSVGLASGTMFLASVESADEWFADAVRELEESDVKSVADYCRALAIDYFVERSDYSHAVAFAAPRLRDVVAGRGGSSLRTATATYLDGCGRAEAALHVLNAASRWSRIWEPQRTKSLRRELAFQLNRATRRQTAWAPLRALLYGCQGQVGLAALTMGAASRRASSEGLRARSHAYAVVRLAQGLETEFAGVSGLEEIRGLRVARAEALRVIAESYRTEGDLVSAASAYLDAFDVESELPRRRWEAANLLAEAVTCAMDAEHPGPDDESHALDLLRTALQLLEDDRGSLGSEDERIEWLTALDDLYRRVFAIAVRGIRYRRRKAAELGSWLLESLHRSAIMTVLPSDRQQAVAESDLAFATSGQPAAGTPSASERGTKRPVDAETGSLPATDLDHFASLAKSAFVLTVHARRIDDAWEVDAAAWGPGLEPVLRRSTITRPRATDIAAFLDPVAVLDAFAERREDVVAPAMGGVVLGDPMWRAVAEALIPPALDARLTRQGQQGILPLNVVPDGPLASLPWMGLILSDNGALARHCAVQMLPTASISRRPHETRRERIRLCAYLGGVDLTEELNAFRSDQGVSVVTTTNGKQFVRHLEAEDFDVATVSSHGRFDDRIDFEDGDSLTPGSALSVRWPGVVLFGTCWTGGASWRAGEMALSFPTACLLAGCRTVLGGIAWITSSAAGRVLASTLQALRDGSQPVAACREAVIAALDETRRVDAETVPSEWAAVAVWSVEAELSPGPPNPETSWDGRGTPRDVVGREAAERVFAGGAALARILHSALQRATFAPPGTLELASAAFDADDADWTSYRVAVGLEEPPLGTFTEFGEPTHVTIDSEVFEVSEALRLAIERGDRLRRRLKDECTLPVHVVLAALLEPTSALSQWVTSREREADAIEALGTRVMGMRLPRADALRRIADKPADEAPIPPEAQHHQADRHDTLLRSHAYRDRRAVFARNCLIALAAMLAAWIPLSGPAEALKRAGEVDTALDHVGFAGLVLGPTVGGGSRVVRVDRGAPAETAGMAQGDVLLTVNKQPVGPPVDAVAVIRSHRPNSEIEVLVQRSGELLTFQLTLTRYP
jgi:hypothetical protein